VKTAGQVLEDVFKENFAPGFLEKAKAASTLLDSWPQALKEAGLPQAAAHSRVVAHEHGVILIEADHPGWVQVLQTKQAQFLEFFQKVLAAQDAPEVRGVSFRISRGPFTA